MNEANKIAAVMLDEIKRLGAGATVFVRGSEVKMIKDGYAKIVVAWVGGDRWIVSYEVQGSWYVSEGVDEEAYDEDSEDDRLVVTMLTHMAMQDVLFGG